MKLPLNPSDIDIKNHHQIEQKQHHHEKSHENLHRITTTPYKSHENLQVFLVFDGFFNQKNSTSAAPRHTSQRTAVQDHLTGRAAHPGELSSLER